MSHEPKPVARLVPSASGTRGKNSAHTEETRRAIQQALPYGAIQRVQERLEGILPAHGVSDQIEGSNRLSVDAMDNALMEIPARRRAEILHRHYRPAGLVVSEEAGAKAPGSLHEALAAVVIELGDVTRLAAGGIDADERADYSREVAELERAVAALKRFA